MREVYERHLRARRTEAAGLALCPVLDHYCPLNTSGGGSVHKPAYVSLVGPPWTSSWAELLVQAVRPGGPAYRETGIDTGHSHAFLFLREPPKVPLRGQNESPILQMRKRMHRRGKNMKI